MVWESESKYFTNLRDDDKCTYIKKLTLESGRLLPDPYNISDGWSDDVTRLPDISWGDVYTYLLEAPSKYIKDKLKRYKSSEAYSLFVSEHIQDVFIFDISQSKYCCIKTSVLSIEKQERTESLYHVWVIMHAKGWVLSSNCTCMAGYIYD